MDYRLNFLKQYLVGHKTELDNEDQVLKKCCELAYSDMLTVGRFFLDKREGLRNKVIETFLIELKKCNYSYSHGLIDKLTELFGNKKIEKHFAKTREKGGKEKSFEYDDYVTTFGLCQKFVNMCFKYFYVFVDNLPTINFSFGKCDCPIDSVILKKLRISKSYTWSKLNKKEYEDIQILIQEKQDKDSKYKQLQHIGRLAFDFINWVNY